VLAPKETMRVSQSSKECLRINLAPNQKTVERRSLGGGG
jgi:hypothetical protein